MNQENSNQPAPMIVVRHLQKPALICSDGYIHTLTFLEKIALATGFRTIQQINEKIMNKNKITNKE